jgi:hypothetical protein
MNQASEDQRSEMLRRKLGIRKEFFAKMYMAIEQLKIEGKFRDIPAESILNAISYYITGLMMAMMFAPDADAFQDGYSTILGVDEFFDMLLNGVLKEAKPILDVIKNSNG